MVQLSEWKLACAGLIVLVLSNAACGDDDGGGVAEGEGQSGPVDMGPDFGNADAATGMPGNLLGPDGGALAPDGGVADIDPCERIEVRNLDLLFVVDNSGSMREEQEALQREFPKLIRALTTGDREGDGVVDFPPLESVHLGVVSSDMGLVGIQGIPGCENLGDDGIMNNIPNPALPDCPASLPRFLTYTAGEHDPDETASDFACVAMLGSEGCGFEQQLEAGLKALWPATDPRVTFLGDLNGLGQTGHGDAENAGFLRDAAGEDTSALGVIVVSDEEDCSSLDTVHFTPDIYLDPNDPLAMQDLNLRCFFNAHNLYPVDRYINGFKALRPGLEQLVFFGAIVGVPPELVNEGALSMVNFEDEAAREEYYQGILDHPQMQEVPDPDRTPEQGGNLTPSCSTESGRAYPPRRIVEVARGFGANAMVQSICQSDFGPAIDVIVGAIGRTVDQACIVE